MRSGGPKELRHGLRETTSFRHIGTINQVKNVPSFSDKDPAYIPSRRRFLLRTFVHTCLCGLFLDLTDTYAPSSEDAARNFSPDKIHLLSGSKNVTFEDLVFRFASTLGFWLTIYCVAIVTYNPFAFVAVASGFSTVDTWRPLFNSPLKAQSIRLFWG